METLGKLFALDTLKEHQLYLSLHFCLFTLCNASVNVLQYVCARLAGATVTKTPTLLGLSTFQGYEGIRKS